MATWSTQGTNYSESNSGATRAYGVNNPDMANTAVGNINKAPGLGLVGIATLTLVLTMLSMQLT